MSAAPPKPSRRRLHRDHGDEANVESSSRFDSSIERESRGEGKSNSEDTFNRDDGVDSGSPERRIRSDGEGESKERDSRGKTVGFSPSAGNSTTPNKPPKKPGKPTKPSSANNTLDNRPTKSDAEEKEEIRVRSTGATPAPGALSSINQTFFSGWYGYRMEPQSQYQNAVLPYSIRGAGADRVWALSVHVKSILADTTGLVKPAVRVHAVYKDSGECLEHAPLLVDSLPYTPCSSTVPPINIAFWDWEVQESLLLLLIAQTNFASTFILFNLAGMYVKSVRMPAVAPETTSFATLDDYNAGQPTWNEDLLLAANFADVVTDEVVLLFEILDLRPSLRTTSAPSQHRGPKRIAWAYLLPVSNGRMNVGICNAWKNTEKTGRGRGGRSASGGAPADEVEEEKEEPHSRRNKKLKLQLYQSIEYDGVVGALQRSIMKWPAPKMEVTDRLGNCPSYPDGIPSVYMQWRRQNYEIIDKGKLSISIGPQETEFTSDAGVVKSTAVNSDGTPQKRKSLDGTDDGMPLAEAELVRNEPKSFNKAKSFAIKRLRSEGEPCALPDKLLHRIPVGPEGAMTIQYSHSGHLLAIGAKSSKLPAPYVGDTSAATILGECYSLRLVDTDTGAEVWAEDAAHHGVIYSISWSLDDSYILTSSGDGTVKVWDVNSVLSQSLEKEGASDADEPFCLYAHVTKPPAYMYSACFQEYAPSPRNAKPNIKSRNDLPKVIAGGSDGRIRVWNGGNFEGYITVENEEDFGANDTAPAAHNNARVQSLVIDSRSRYLISGDSLGNIFVWRTDSHGWYQLLRRFKQDLDTINPDVAEYAALMQSGGVQSLSMHPDKSKSQVLVLNQCPPHLKLYSTSTYRPISNCSGIGAGQVVGRSMVSKGNVNTSGAVFGRATLSPDGHYAVTGVSSSSSGGDGHYNLKFWDVKQGNLFPASLSDINLPYPVRSISWHPTQHAIAVAMVGHGAAVVVYCGEKESAELSISRRAENAMDSLLAESEEKK
eukprot:GSChrysophyteH1.ASY1.ANO1.275.1 assembled CDS